MTCERRNIVKLGADVIRYVKWLTSGNNNVIHYAEWLTYRQNPVIHNPYMVNVLRSLRLPFS